METNKMKKKIFFILLITCILFSVSGVFAGDINDTAVASDETALVGESSDLAMKLLWLVKALTI